VFGSSVEDTVNPEFTSTNVFEVGEITFGVTPEVFNP